MVEHLNIDELVLKDSSNVNQYSLDGIRNKIIQGDALEVMNKIPDESVDLVFIDPPYFLQLPKKKLVRWNVRTKVEGVEDEWDKFESFEEYDSFIEKILTQTNRIMKENATVWIISTYHSVHRIGKIMQDFGYWLLSDVLWLKNNPMPNWLGVRFTNATETIIWAVKDKKSKKYTFKKELAKEYGIGKVGANVWVIPLCTGKERIKKEDGEKLHSTQKPAELLKRIILTTSNEGDLILDPMAGTGTTGHVAKELKRDFVMIEREQKYIEGMKERFKIAPNLKDRKKSSVEKEVEKNA